MNFTTRKILISSLCVFLVCLIASAATQVVCAEESNVEEEEPYWGNLKTGDEMHWKWSPSYASGSLYELKILELQGERLKAFYKETYFPSRYNPTGEARIKQGIATFTSDELFSYIYPAALLQEHVGFKNFRSLKYVILTTYEYQGNTYLAAYLKTGGSEYWWDYSTGILFFITDRLRTDERYLEYTNANLTTPEMVPGYQRLFLQGYLKQHWIDLVVTVALVSVVAIFSYSFIWRAWRATKMKKN